MARGRMDADHILRRNMLGQDHQHADAGLDGIDGRGLAPPPAG